MFPPHEAMRKCQKSPDKQQGHHSCRQARLCRDHTWSWNFCLPAVKRSPESHSSWRPSWQWDLCLPLSKANSQLLLHNEAESESSANWMLKWGSKPNITTQMYLSFSQKKNLPYQEANISDQWAEATLMLRWERKTVDRSVKAAVINVLEQTAANLPKTMS